MTVIEYRRNPVKAIRKTCPAYQFRMGTRIHIEPSGR